MKRIRLIGLAVVAAVAFSAVAASAASATKFNSTGFPNEVILSGSSTGQEFTVNSGTIDCTGTFGATAHEALEMLKVTASYTACTFASFNLPEVKMNGCTYLFHAGEKLAEKHYKGTVDVECSGTNEIEVKTATCIVKVGAQKGLAGIEYVNVGEGATEEVEVNAEVKSIAYKEGSLCVDPNTSQTNGVYKGKVKTKGENAAENRVGIFVE